MSNKVKIWLPFLLSITMTLGIFIGFKMRDSFPNHSFFSTQKETPIQEILDLIKNNYVDEIDFKKLSDTAITAILAKLDPHSIFIPASEVEEINNDITGNFYGIGIEFEMIHDTLNIVQVIDGGPSKKAGLQCGDKILKVNETIIAGKKFSSDSIRNTIKGEQGTSIQLAVLRDFKKIIINVKRDNIPVNSIDCAYMIDSITGYIKIDRFTTHTYKEFMTALTTLKKSGLKKLILDLRDNGGGVLEEAVEIADEFLDGDKLITYTEGKHTPKKEYRCRRTGQFEQGTLYVLSDEGSASASEILMGALQDWDRATIIGRRSFGKGLVQQQYELNDNSALRLTIARYYTPTGRSIQRSYQNGLKAYYEEVESIDYNQSTNHAGKTFKTPSGRTLYGQGGISPDVYINADTTTYDEQLSLIFTKRIINQFSLNYFVTHKKEIAAYQNFTHFAKSFQMSEADWNNFSNYLSKDSIDFSKTNVNDKKNIEHSIKSLLARYNWGKSGYYQVLNMDDVYFNKILKP
jgi:carboxyl-terminal processing protease